MACITTGVMCSKKRTGVRSMLANILLCRILEALMHYQIEQCSPHQLFRATQETISTAYVISLVCPRESNLGQ